VGWGGGGGLQERKEVENGLREGAGARNVRRRGGDGAVNDGTDGARVQVNVEGLSSSSANNDLNYFYDHLAQVHKHMAPYGCLSPDRVILLLLILPLCPSSACALMLVPARIDPVHGGSRRF